jgi:H+/gluconate symporter-like permease
MKKRKNGNSIKTIIIIITIVFVLLLPLIIDYLRKSREIRDEEEKKQIETEVTILHHLKKEEHKKLQQLEILNKYVPYIIRFSLVLFLSVYDYKMCQYFGKGSNELIDILKEVTIYNASLLSVILCIAFIFNGKMWKIEEIIAYVNQSIKDKVFNYYFPEVDMRQNSKNWYREDIEKREIRIQEINDRLNKNGITSHSK